jgi:lipopolysaccharide export system permease protein
MQLIERYLFRQLLGPTLLATGALSILALLSQSLSVLDILVNERQSPLLVAKIVLLATPHLIVIILPVAILVSALAALNRLHTEQEIVICFAGGMSRWRVISPAIRLAVLASLVSLALGLWIQPLCYRTMRVTLEEVRTDLAATMIKPGQFTHPAPGLTVYAQSLGDDGVIHNLFVDIAGKTGRDTTVTAREGRLEARHGAPVLVLRHGANQEFSPTGVLNFLSFDEYALDLAPLVALDRTVNYKPSDRYLRELFFPDLSRQFERANRWRLLAEGHARLSGPLYNIAFMAMAFAGVVGGSFSRMGYGARIAAVAGAALFVRTLGFAALVAAGSKPELNFLQYAAPLLALMAAAAVIFGRFTPVAGKRDAGRPMFGEGVPA